MGHEAARTPVGGALPAAALPVLHLDARLLVIDKPAGLLVHRTALDAHESDTVIARLRRSPPFDDPATPLPAAVHRLDKGTSGVLVLARDTAAAALLRQAFDLGQVHKRYLAVVRGWPADEGAIDHPLSADPERPSAGQVLRPAHTRWRTLARWEWPFSADASHATTRCALIEALPTTGRRHQVRRHLKHIGHPLVGDATHGKGALNRAVAGWLGLQRLWLHAVQITLPHPDDGRPLAVTAPQGPEWHMLPCPPGTRS